MALADVLKRHMVKVGETSDTRVAWASKLNLDAPTFSKVLNGQLGLTHTRAEKWAFALYPHDPVAREECIRDLVAAQEAKGPTVAQFCDRVVAEMGAVPAERIAELFTALCDKSTVSDPLVCVVYRDMPRAAPDAKFPGIGHDLAKAIANGLNFAMFLPFGEDVPSPLPLGQPTPYAELIDDTGKSDAEKWKVSPAARTAAFMQDINEACRGAYISFQRDAVSELIKSSGYSNEVAMDLVRNRLRLYEASGCERCTSGFSGKIFYIQWWDNNRELHKRIFEWVSTPTRDWFLYRGEINLNPDALRDSFYPIPHFFDFLYDETGSGDRRLPTKLDPVADREKYQALWDANPGFRHPRPGAWKLSAVCR